MEDGCEKKGLMGIVEELRESREKKKRSEENRSSRNNLVMEDEFSFSDTVPPSFDRGVKNAINDEVKGFNPGLIVLLVVGGLVLLFLVGNYALYMYAQKTLPPRKKKPISKKKIKKERLKQGVSAPGE
ncbi:DNA-binding protein S1FA [Cinnamomum micranthum f. kanehirae]|uniref:DNA-binding protein S1FA n=1 Tax=Cinnamomum micranthum f. kanehirae TaxID=337451 RepID=A0A443PXS5_9MAGN|nr:DNA-binding protein S1FA [Cinnamomum micranthum f. kanehirae]